RVGLAEQHRLHIARQQLALVVHILGHMELPGHSCGQGWRAITDDGDLEFLLNLGKVRQIMQLADRTAANNSKAYGGHSAPPGYAPSPPARGARSFQTVPIA